MINIAQITETRTGKILILIWIMILAILIGVPVISLFTGGLLENIIFSTLPVAILINIAIILSYNVKKGTQRITKISWLILSIAIVAYALILINPKQPRAGEEIGMVIGYPMLILSFPSSFLIIYLYYGIARLFDNFGWSILPHSGAISFYLLYFIFWFGFFIGGYFQWFKLVPFLARRKKIEDRKRDRLIY